MCACVCACVCVRVCACAGSGQGAAHARQALRLPRHGLLLRHSQGPNSLPPPHPPPFLLSSSFLPLLPPPPLPHEALTLATQAKQVLEERRLEGTCPLPPPSALRMLACGGVKEGVAGGRGEHQGGVCRRAPAPP
eukprot:1476858-Rhodomonas_salina.1